MSTKLRRKSFIVNKPMTNDVSVKEQFTDIKSTTKGYTVRDWIVTGIVVIGIITLAVIDSDNHASDFVKYTKVR